MPSSMGSCMHMVHIHPLKHTHTKQIHIHTHIHIIYTHKKPDIVVVHTCNPSVRGSEFQAILNYKQDPVSIKSNRQRIEAHYCTPSNWTTQVGGGRGNELGVQTCKEVGAEGLSRVQGHLGQRSLKIEHKGEEKGKEEESRRGKEGKGVGGRQEYW